MAIKKYKPNVVYVLKIDDQFYVGCHCCSQEISEAYILTHSANPLIKAHWKKLLSLQEYKDCCQLFLVEEYDSKEEALNREVKLIAEYKKKYGPLCLNKCLGNKYGNKGLVFSEEHRRNLVIAQNKRTDRFKPVQQFTKDGQFIAQYFSMKEAEEQTGISRHSISACCGNKRKFAGNCEWRYA